MYSVLDSRCHLAFGIRGSFQGLPCGCGCFRPPGHCFGAAVACWILATVPLPSPFLVYCFYDVIVNKAVRAVFKKHSAVPLSKWPRSSSVVEYVDSVTSVLVPVKLGLHTAAGGLWM